MREDTTIPFRSPAFRDGLSDLVREGRQALYVAAALFEERAGALQHPGLAGARVALAADAVRGP